MRRSYKSLYRRMNKGQGKNGKRKSVLLVLILIIAAVAVTAIFLFKSNIINFARKDGIVAVAGEVNIETAERNPTVTFKTAKGNVYNKITGVSGNDFTFEKDINTYSPLDTDRKQRISIDVDKNSIKSISYEVRKISDGSLMEKTDVSYTSNGGNTDAELNIKNLLNPNEKYQLQIRVEYTDKTLYYNTLIENRGSAYLDEKIAFVNSFSDNIYDSAKEKEVFSYLAPKSGVDITNYAVADIFSPTSLVTWNTLNPKKVSRETPTVIGVDDNSTRMTMSYPISLTGSDGKEKRIVVNESYTVRMMANGKVNLINYQRRAEETLLPDSVSVSNNSLLLGFNYSSEVEGSSSRNGRFTAFKNGGNLWLADNGGKLSEIFTFDVNESNNSDLNTTIKVDDKGYIQSCERSYGINIINVTDDGKVTFAVYGTQMAGEHAGETGIALFNYDGSVLKEVVFVKSNANLNELKVQAESSYLNDNNLYYVVSGNTMYAINTDSHNSDAVLTDIQDGKFSASGDRSVIAYDGAKNGSGYVTEIKLYNRNRETANTVTAGEGETVKTIGYIGSDFVYGVADVSDIIDDKVYFKKFIIIDAEGNQVTSYESNGMRYADPVISANDLSFDRYNKNGNTYNKIDNNKLIGKNMAGSAGYTVSFDAGNASNTYRKQLYMTFTNGLNFSGNADAVKKWKYMQPDTAVLNNK
ncbi:hypothetical protein [Howardella ureilytica]